jgi:hypothetical protein
LRDLVGFIEQNFPHRCLALNAKGAGGVDIPSGYVRFDEKDEDYRVNVVRSFAALRPILA